MKKKNMCNECNITWKIGIKTKESKCPKCHKQRENNKK